MHPAVAVCASLGCALTWAFASVTFARVMRSHDGVAPQALNLVKSAIAVPVLFVACAVVGGGVPVVAASDVGFLVVSALLGLLVADTGYFFALKKLGAARGVLFIPLVPLVTAVLAAVLLDEGLSLQAIVGMVITLTGLGVVLTQKEPPSNSSPSNSSLSNSSPSNSSPSNSLVPGLLGGGLYALAQAGANVAAKHVLDHAEAVVVATLRLTVGLVALLVVSLGTGALPGLRVVAGRTVWPGVVVAALVGTVGGIWLGSVGAKHLPVAVATTLAATTPLWALLLSRLAGEAVRPRSFAGASIAVVGVVVLATAATK